MNAGESERTAPPASHLVRQALRECSSGHAHGRQPVVERKHVVEAAERERAGRESARTPPRTLLLIATSVPVARAARRRTDCRAGNRDRRRGDRRVEHDAEWLRLKTRTRASAGAIAAATAGSASPRDPRKRSRPRRPSQPTSRTRGAQTSRGGNIRCCTTRPMPRSNGRRRGRTRDRASSPGRSRRRRPRARRPGGCDRPRSRRRARAASCARPKDLRVRRTT